MPREVGGREGGGFRQVERTARENEVDSAPVGFFRWKAASPLCRLGLGLGLGVGAGLGLGLGLGPGLGSGLGLG